MAKLQLVSHSSIASDHIIAKIRVGLQLGTQTSFVEGLQLLLDTMSFGGEKVYKFERPDAREAYRVKPIFYEEIEKRDKGNYGFIDIAIPLALCNPKDGIPLLLSVIYYASVYSFVQSFELLDIEFPDNYIRQFPGPKYGTNALGNSDQIKFGLILKPRSVINQDRANDVVYKAAKGGIDYIIDDELTVDPTEWGFIERVSFVTNLLSSVEEETGKHVSYIANVTSAHKRSLHLAHIADDFGIDGIMVNSVMMGHDVIQELSRNKNYRPMIVANVIGRSLISGGPDYRMSDHVICLISRLSGADAVYTGTFAGDIRNKNEQASLFMRALTEPLSLRHPLKPCFAIMSGGINLRNVLDNWKFYLGPAMIQMGSGLNQLADADFPFDEIMNTAHIIFRLYKEVGEKNFHAELAKVAEKDRAIKNVLAKLGWEEIN